MFGVCDFNLLRWLKVRKASSDSGYGIENRVPVSAVAVVRARKKLIEVALPLDAVNKASAGEKSIRHVHPSTLHLWRARRPECR